MSYEEIKNKLKDILVEILILEKTSDEIIGEDLISELGINSIDAISIFIEIEDTFNIVIEDENLNASLIANLDNTVKFVYDKLNQ